MYDPKKRAVEVGKWIPNNRLELIELEDQRYQYSLTPESLVFDFGAFDGIWAKKLYEKYQCKIYSFEPVYSLYEKCLSTVSDLHGITVFNFGLAPSHNDIDVQISIEGDASSMYSNNTGSHTGKKIDECKLKSFSKFLNEYSISNIELVKMNIEGAEFDLLDFIIENKYHLMMNNIQIQFHEFMDNCFERRNRIISELQKTHNVSWDYPWVLESWSIK